MTNKTYILSVSLLTFFLPVISSFIESISNNSAFLSFDLFGKWFIFFAVGIRLFMAGIKQIKDPGFTAKQIFQIESQESFPIVRELGFANLCFGLIGIISLFLPQWRIVSAFGSGLYYGIAGFQHLVRKPSGTNEKFALVTDLIIFSVLLLYFVKSI